MNNNIGNKIWKQCISQSVAPATMTDQPGVLHKLGLTWIPQYAPGFYLNSKQIRILNEPTSFYKLMIEQIGKAKNRIVLASLYLGNGSLEKDMIIALQERLDKKPNLKIKILLDCTRGSRGELNSRKMIIPLLKNYEKSCQVSLYQTPLIQSPFIPFLPEKYKECFGLQHMKVYLFDNNVIISGANLSNDYFTNRQDRYILISECKEFSDFIEGLVDKVSGISLQLDADDKLSIMENWPHDPLTEKPEVFNSAASSWIRNYYESFINTNKEENGDTVIFPLLEMGPFNIHLDNAVTNSLLERCGSDTCVHLTTGYFNLTQSYISTIINKSNAQYKILMAHPEANGFYNAKGPAGGIPHAYTNIASEFLKSIERNQESFRIKMFEYLRSGWTYHAKGLWVSPSDVQLPFLTMIGSPNFGERSLRLDLECQFLLATTDPELQNELLKERDFLYESCQPFTEDTCLQPQRQTPLWVKIVSSFIRNYL